MIPPIENDQPLGLHDLPNVLYASIAGLSMPGADHPLAVPENLDTTFTMDADGAMMSQYTLDPNNILLASQVLSGGTMKHLKNYPHIQEFDEKFDYACQAGGDEPDLLPGEGEPSSAEETSTDEEDNLFEQVLA